MKIPREYENNYKKCPLLGGDNRGPLKGVSIIYCINEISIEFKR